MFRGIEKMKNLYLVQPSSNLSDSVFLPYSVGSLAAYALKHEKIKSKYNLCDFVFMKLPVDEVVSEMNNPCAVGFSCYMWNIEYNLVLAEKIKSIWPSCKIVFGGPQIPDNTEYLEKYSFIDVLIHGEGEVPFHLILDHIIDGADFSDIANISFRDNDILLKTSKVDPCSLDDFPSPYETGLFDNIINNPKYKNLSFDAVIETNRGCPYGCIYCYWARSGTSFRAFPIDRVKRDLEWIAKNQIQYCVCADANYGILDRDEEIADFLVETKKKYGFPKRFETASDKNKTDLTFKINQKLELSNLNRGVSVAVQSMSPVTLEIIGRKNMSVNKLSEQLNKYRKHNIDTYTDLILGLPGETLESFCKGLFEVIEAGQHYAIAVHRCEVFPNTIIYTDEIREKYKIKTISSQLCQKHSRIDKSFDFSSRSQIIVGTSTMSTPEWYTAQRVAICTQSFHSMGLLRFFAVYLRKAKNISYHDFYMNLYKWIETESVTIKKLLDRTCETFEPFLNGKGNLYFADERFGNIYWDFDDGMFLCCAAELEDFYADVKNYLARYFDDHEVFYDLMTYQKEMIALPAKEEKEIHTAYDWHDYFNFIFDNSVTVPVKKPTALKAEKSETDNWPDYARETVWFGRRSGKSLNKVNYIL